MKTAVDHRHPAGRGATAWSAGLATPAITPWGRDSSVIEVFGPASPLGRAASAGGRCRGTTGIGSCRGYATAPSRVGPNGS
ncbi:MAG: hypothetical protein QF786_07895, partial [Vicinamibacterales bacterium]|nr:hypothetical protein [Vicinamibacterales bacterium]